MKRKLPSMKELREKSGDNKKQIQLTFKPVTTPVAVIAPALPTPAAAASVVVAPVVVARAPVKEYLWTSNPGGKIVGNSSAVKAILTWTSSCLLLQGPCGSGKTALAKAAMKKRGLTVMDVRDAQDLSDASLKDTLDVLCFQNEAGAALFMDELETLIPADRRTFLQWLRKVPPTLIIVITVGEEDYRQTKALCAALPDRALNLKLARTPVPDLVALADAIQVVNNVKLDKAQVDSAACRANGDRRKFITSLQWLHSTNNVKGVASGDVYDGFDSAFGAAQHVLSGKLPVDDAVFVDKFLSPMLLFENYPRACDDLDVTSAALSDCIAFNYTTPQVAACLANRTVAHTSHGSFSYPSFPKGLANTSGKALAMRQVARKTGIEDVLLLDVGLPVVSGGAKGKALGALAKKLALTASDFTLKRF